jgi:hypothetical protein
VQPTRQEARIIRFNGSLKPGATFATTRAKPIIKNISV